MDAAAIRQALRDTVGLTLDHPTADEAQEVLRAAAAAYADLLDGPTNGAFLVEPEDGFWPTWACDALTELFAERGIYWKSGPKRQGVVGAEEVLERLEAVFQARKERG